MNLNPSFSNPIIQSARMENYILQHPELLDDFEFRLFLCEFVENLEKEFNDKGYQEGYKDGKDAGYSEGYDDGYDDGEDTVE